MLAELLQLVFNGIYAGSAYALLGGAFGLLLGCTRVIRFELAGIYAIGAYAALGCISFGGLPQIVASVLGVFVAVSVGVLGQLLVFRPMQRRSASTLTQLIAALGIYTVLQNTISITAGDEIRRLGPWLGEKGFWVYGAHVTWFQLMTVCVFGSLLGGLAALLRFTSWGKQIRAVSSDADLALCIGVATDRVILVAVALASGLCGAGAVLTGMDTGLMPAMGFRPMVMGIIAAIVGGVGSLRGAVVGGLGLGLVMHLGVWRISAHWQDAIAFLVLLAFLLVKPQGMFGRPLARATV